MVPAPSVASDQATLLDDALAPLTFAESFATPPSCGFSLGAAMSILIGAKVMTALDDFDGSATDHFTPFVFSLAPVTLASSCSLPPTTSGFGATTLTTIAGMSRFTTADFDGSATELTVITIFAGVVPVGGAT